MRVPQAEGRRWGYRQKRVEVTGPKSSSGGEHRGSRQKVGLVGLEQSLQLSSNASGEPWTVRQRHENLGPHTASRAVGVGNGQGEQTQKEKVHSLRAERGSHNLGKRNRTGTSEAVRMVSA